MSGSWATIASIAVTKAHIDMPEIRDAVEAGRLAVDGIVLRSVSECRVTKAAIEPECYLPGVAERYYGPMKSLLSPLLCAASLFAIASTSTGCGLRSENVTERSAGEGDARLSESPVESADAAGPDESVSQTGLAVHLPKVSLPIDGSPDYAFLIRATPERVTATNAPAIEPLRASDERRVKDLLQVSEEAGLRLEVEGEADPRRATNHLIGDLFEVLAEAVEVERRWGANLDRSPSLKAALALDASLPMGTVVDLLYTAGRAEIDSYVAQAEGPSGILSLPFSPLRMTCPTTPTECLSPVVFVANDGIFVGVIDGPTPYTCDPRLRKKPRTALLRSAAGRCPSVAGLAGVDELLDAVDASTPLCKSVYLGGGSGVAWGDVVPLLASLARRGPVELNAERLIDLSCAEAVGAEEVLSSLRG